eukprot:5750709-Amphidinium_carterae.1
MPVAMLHVAIPCSDKDIKRRLKASGALWPSAASLATSSVPYSSAYHAVRSSKFQQASLLDRKLLYYYRSRVMAQRKQFRPPMPFKTKLKPKVPRAS